MTGERGEECLFCTLAKKEEGEAHWIVRRGRYWYVILNTYPYTNGHIMVACNRHVENIGDLGTEERAELIELLSRGEAAIRKAYRPDGINLGANLGRSAGAGIVGHIHIHLVPRWHGDTNFMTAIGETRIISEDLLETYRKLKRAFE